MVMIITVIRIVAAIRTKAMQTSPESEDLLGLPLGFETVQMIAGRATKAKSMAQVVKPIKK